MSDARRDPHSRIYHRVEREYPDIYYDDRAWAAYTRMLVIADRSYPTPPPLPGTVSRSILAKLIASGIICVEQGTYRPRGHDKERAGRVVAAKRAATARWGNGRE